MPNQNPVGNVAMDEDRLLEHEVGTVLSGLRDIALNRLHRLGTACICRIHVGGLCCGHCPTLVHTTWICSDHVLQPISNLSSTELANMLKLMYNLQYVIQIVMQPYHVKEAY